MSDLEILLTYFAKVCGEHCLKVNAGKKMIVDCEGTISVNYEINFDTSPQSVNVQYDPLCKEESR